MARIKSIIQRIRKGYERWMESAAFIVWVLILTLLWIGLTHNV